MPSNLLVQPREYQSAFIPTDYKYIQDRLDYMQQRYDSTKAAKSAAFMQLNDQDVATELSGQRKAQLMKQLEEQYGNISSKYMGDLGAASGDIVDFIGTMRNDPFWKLNQKQLEKQKEYEQIRTKLLAEGKTPLEFNKVPEIWNSETGEYANPENINYELEGKLFDSPIMESMWDGLPSISNEGGVKVSESAPGFYEYSTTEGISGSRIKGYLDQAMERFRETDNYRQRIKEYTKLGYTDPVSGKTKTLTQAEADAKIESQLLATGMERKGVSSKKGYLNIPNDVDGSGPGSKKEIPFGNRVTTLPYDFLELDTNIETGRKAADVFNKYLDMSNNNASSEKNYKDPRYKYPVYKYPLEVGVGLAGTFVWSEINPMLETFKNYGWKIKTMGPSKVGNYYRNFHDADKNEKYKVKDLNHFIFQHANGTTKTFDELSRTLSPIVNSKTKALEQRKKQLEENDAQGVGAKVVAYHPELMPILGKTLVEHQDNTTKTLFGGNTVSTIDFAGEAVGRRAYKLSGRRKEIDSMGNIIKNVTKNKGASAKDYAIRVIGNLDGNNDYGDITGDPLFSIGEVVTLNGETYILAADAQKAGTNAYKDALNIQKIRKLRKKPLVNSTHWEEPFDGIKVQYDDLKNIYNVKWGVSEQYGYPNGKYRFSNIKDESDILTLPNVMKYLETLFSSKDLETLKSGDAYDAEKVLEVFNNLNQA